MESHDGAKYAIHAACREGQTNLVESLLNTDPKLAARQDDDARLPLHWAASYNRVPIAELLSERKGFDPDAQDGAGWTAVMMAASLADGDAMLDLLLARSADATMRTNTGQTALHFAASKQHLAAARALLAHGASARAQDRRAQLPLHRAAAIGSVPLVRLLLEHGSALDAADRDGMTALHHAVAEGRGEAAVVLLRAGAETGKRDASGCVAIALAPDERVRGYVLRTAGEEGIEVVLR